MSAPKPEDWVALGILGKARGLRGDLWFRSYNDAVSSLGAGVTVRVVAPKAAPRMLTVQSLAGQGTGLVAHFEGIDDRNGADALVGATVELQRKHFPPLDEGEYYHCDLEGMRVVDVEGRALGTVLRVEAYPTIDALVVKTAKGELELPINTDVVRAMDVAAALATVDLSTLDLDAADDPRIAPDGDPA